MAKKRKTYPKKDREYKVYYLRNQSGEIVYVGQTVQKIETRLRQHKREIERFRKAIGKPELEKKLKKQSFYSVCVHNNWEIDIEVIHTFNNRKESLLYEAYHILKQKIELNNLNLQNRFIDKFYI